MMSSSFQEAGIPGDCDRGAGKREEREDAPPPKRRAYSMAEPGRPLSASVECGRRRRERRELLLEASHATLEVGARARIGERAGERL